MPINTPSISISFAGPDEEQAKDLMKACRKFMQKQGLVEKTQSTAVTVIYDFDENGNKKLDTGVKRFRFGLSGDDGSGEGTSY